VASNERRWIDRTRPLWRIGNRIEAFELRHLGRSVMSMINRGEVIALETIGRRSGRLRYAPVACWRDDHGAFIVGGGAAGMATVPDWVKNLRSTPAAAVWVRRSRIPVTAHELSGDDRARARDQAIRIWRSVRRYERKSGRVIPYFRLEPT